MEQLWIGSWVLKLRPRRCALRPGRGVAQSRRRRDRRRGGTVGFGAHLRVGDDSRALAGPGLVAPRGAAVILVLKTHGPKIPRHVSDQLHTFAGGRADQSDAPPNTPPELLGTPGPNDCAEIQVSVQPE